MSLQPVARSGRTKAVGPSFRSRCSSWAPQAAQAQEVRTYPGSSCQASGSAQDLAYSTVSVANRGDSSGAPSVRSCAQIPWPDG